MSLDSLVQCANQLKDIEKSQTFALADIVKEIQHGDFTTTRLAFQQASCVMHRRDPHLIEQELAESMGEDWAERRIY